MHQSYVTITSDKKKWGAFFLCLLLVLVGNLALAQTHFYRPDGTQLKSSDGSIRAVLEQHFPGMPPSVHFPDDTDEASAAVIFKKLTNEPLFLLTDHPDRIPDYIASFDYDAYLSSWRFEFDLESGVEDGITDIYILEALGAPDSITSRTTATSDLALWTYSQLDIELVFNRGRLVTVTTHR